MEYQEIIAAVADETRYTRREIRKILRVLARVAQEALGAGRDVQLRGIGRFKNVPGKARKGRNKFTGEPIDIPPTRRLRFRPSDPIVDALKKSEAVFVEDSLEQRYGLAKEKNDGKVRGRDRPEQGPKGKEGRGGG